MKKKLIFAVFAVLLAAFISCDPDGKEKEKEKEEEEEKGLELPQFLQNTVWVSGEPAYMVVLTDHKRDIIRFGVDTVTISECWRHKDDEWHYLGRKSPETFNIKMIESLPYTDDGLYISFTDNVSEYIHTERNYLKSAFHGNIERVGDWHKVGNDMYFYELLEDGTYEISGFYGKPDKNNFILPGSYLGKAITRIGNFAFFPNEKLEISRVTIPNSIKFIGGGAFFNRNNLYTEGVGITTVTIGPHVDLEWGYTGISGREWTCPISEMDGQTFMSAYTYGYDGHGVGVTPEQSWKSRGGTYTYTIEEGWHQIWE